MIKHILKADWLDDEMRKIVLHKIKKMGKNIGYPNWYNNATFMTNYYRGVSWKILKIIYIIIIINDLL